MADLETAGVGVDGREDVEQEREQEQQWIEHGHALQQEDGGRLSLVFTQHEERRDVAGQAEDTDKTDDHCTYDEVIEIAAGLLCVRGLLDIRRQSHVIGAFRLHIVNASQSKSEMSSKMSKEDSRLLF